MPAKGNLFRSGPGRPLSTMRTRSILTLRQPARCTTGDDTKGKTCTDRQSFNINVAELNIFSNILSKINQMPSWVYEENLCVQAGWDKKGLKLSHKRICISSHWYLICAGKGILNKWWVLYDISWMLAKTSATLSILNCIDNSFGRQANNT